MATIFWYSQGIVRVDYLEEGLRINGVYYAEKLRLLDQKIVKKRRGKMTQGVLFLQDDAPSCLRLNAASRSFLIPSVLQI